MDILYTSEHTSCVHFDITQKPQIEKVKIAKGTERSIDTKRNVVLFVLEGKLRLVFRSFPRFQVSKGQIMFLPAPDTYTYKALSTATVIIFRLDSAVQLCENFKIDRLYDARQIPDNEYKPQTKNYSVLEITPRIWHFLDGLVEDVDGGVQCRSYFDLQIKKFFMLVRFFYTKEEIHDFFYYILSGDTAFSEAVRLRWREYNSVEELAESMNMTPKRFTKQFKIAFGSTPYKWMNEGRARLICQQINDGRPFKHIADEFRFPTVQDFSRFVKKQTGKTPSELRGNGKERM